MGSIHVRYLSDVEKFEEFLLEIENNSENQDICSFFSIEPLSFSHEKQALKLKNEIIIGLVSVDDLKIEPVPGKNQSAEIIAIKLKGSISEEFKFLLFLVKTEKFKNFFRDLAGKVKKIKDFDNITEKLALKSEVFEVVDPYELIRKNPDIYMKNREFYENSHVNNEKNQSFLKNFVNTRSEIWDKSKEFSYLLESHSKAGINNNDFQREIKEKPLKNEKNEENKKEIDDDKNNNLPKNQQNNKENKETLEKSQNISKIEPLKHKNMLKKINTVDKPFEESVDSQFQVMETPKITETPIKLTDHDTLLIKNDSLQQKIPISEKLIGKSIKVTVSPEKINESLLKSKENEKENSFIENNSLQSDKNIERNLFKSDKRNSFSPIKEAKGNQDVKTTRSEIITVPIHNAPLKMLSFQENPIEIPLKSEGISNKPKSSQNSAKKLKSAIKNDKSFENKENLPENVPKNTQNEEFLEKIKIHSAILKQGRFFMKFGLRDFFCPSKTQILFEEDLSKFYWGKGKKKKIFSLNEIVEIRYGRNTKNFKRFGIANKEKNQRSFSIITKGRSIDLQTGTVKEKEEFLEALSQVMAWKKCTYGLN